MKISEQQIEKIIYESPWLLDERFIIPKIAGKGGEYGRQINVGKDNNRYIDLLFKDTRDNRPVIIELKKGRIIRENIAQTLEYRALITSLSENVTEKWFAEFGQNYYAPKMILIGSDADEETILSANLAGIEIRTFDTNYDDKIGFETFNELKTKLKEWNSFRNLGKRTFIERDEWIESIIERVNQILDEEFEDITTINRPFNVNGKKCYIPYVFPFLNIPIKKDDEVIVGLYEYSDEILPFDEKYFYCDIGFLFEYESDQEVDTKFIAFAKKKIESLKFDLINYRDFVTPVIKIYRETLESETEFRRTIKAIIKISLEIYDKYVELEV